MRATSPPDVEDGLSSAALSEEDLSDKPEGQTTGKAISCLCPKWRGLQVNLFEAMRFEFTAELIMYIGNSNIFAGVSLFAEAFVFRLLLRWSTYIIVC